MSDEGGATVCGYIHHPPRMECYDSRHQYFCFSCSETFMSQCLYSCLHKTTYPTLNVNDFSRFSFVVAQGSLGNYINQPGCDWKRITFRLDAWETLPKFVWKESPRSPRITMKPISIEAPLVERHHPIWKSLHHTETSHQMRGWSHEWKDLVQPEKLEFHSRHFSRLREKRSLWINSKFLEFHQFCLQTNVNSLP